MRQYDFIFGYARLSDDDDDKKDESNSIKNQKLLIRQYIQSREDLRDAGVEFCVDDGFSGTNYDRPGFQKMMEMVKSRPHSIIIVKDLARLGRDTVDTQNYIEKVFPFMQVRFIAVNDGYDSDDPVARRKDSEAKFKNLVNGIYPQICSQNVKQAMRKQAEAGKFHGAVPPYGYRFKGDNRTLLYIDEEPAQVVRLIFEKRAAGEKYTEIARELNDGNITIPAEYLRKKGFAVQRKEMLSIWTVDIIKRILQNPVYTGAVVNHKTESVTVSQKSGVPIPREEWICIPGMHEAIISQEEFDKVQPVKKPDKRCRQTKAPGYIFSGKLRCGHCRRPVRVRRDGTLKAARIYCRTRYYKETSCYKSGIKFSDVEKTVLALVRQQAAIAEDTVKRIRELNKGLDIPKMQRQLERQEEKIQQCGFDKMQYYERYTSGEWTKERFIEEKEKVSRKMNQYREEADALREEIRQAGEGKKKEADENLLSLAKYTELEELSYPIVQELIEKIYIYDPEHIEIVWNYRDEYLAELENAGEGMNAG